MADNENPDSAVSGVDKIITELRNRRHGRYPQVEEEWWCVPLSLDEFKMLEEHIEADEDLRGYVEYKAKYDYFPNVSKFVLRMAGTVHESLIEGFKCLIIEQLLDIKRGNDQVAADFARDIWPRGSPKIKTNNDPHCPDGSFAHKDATKLGIILEVSHSQKREDLPFLADAYILGSDGLTQAVIGIDLEYRENKGKEAKVMVWRPSMTEKKGETVLATRKTFQGIFRDTDGNLVNSEQNLQIWLKDFGNKFDCPGIQEVPGAITISFAQLYELVQASEAFDQTQKRGPDEVLKGESRKMVY